MDKKRAWMILTCVVLALAVLTGWSWPKESTGPLSNSPSADLEPVVTATTPTTVADDMSEMLSPDGKWIAVVYTATGGLDVRRTADGQVSAVFAAGSTVDAVTWSPDSRRLLAVRRNWTDKEPRGSGIDVVRPIEIWRVDMGAQGPGTPARLLQSGTLPTGGVRGDGAEQIVLGSWSPDSRYLLFWLGPLGASILADGLMPLALETISGQVTQLAESALLNPRYHSWAPDGSALVLTAGDYRSAQVNKWLVLFDAATAQVTTVVSSTDQIPGIVAWSPAGDVIAYAAVPAVQTGNDVADLMTWDNPAIAARRIYLLDPDSGEHGRLNSAESFQDAPVWSDDGLTLYYVERQGDSLVVMAANPTSGEAVPVEGAQESLPEFAGYYGQSDLDGLLALRPGGYVTAAGPTPAVTPVPSPAPAGTPTPAADQDVLRFIFEGHAAEVGDLSKMLLQQVASGQYADYSRQDVDVNDDGQPEILVTGRSETFYLFVAILTRDAAGQLRELFYTQNTEGRYAADVSARLERGPLGKDKDRLRVVAVFMTLTGGTGVLNIGWEQRWIVCQTGADACNLFWTAPLLQAERNVNMTLDRSTTQADVEQPDGDMIRLTLRRYGISLPLADATDGQPSTMARRIVGPDTLTTYRWDGTAYRLESRVQLAPGLEIAREFDAQTQETNDLVFRVVNGQFWGSGGHFDHDGYQKLHSDMWGLPAPDQPDDPSWGSSLRQPDVAAYRGTEGESDLWVAGIVGALDRPLCRLSVHREAADGFTRVGRVDVPCTPAFTHLMWADVTGDGVDDLLLLTIAPEPDALGRLQRLYLFTTTDDKLTQVATLDGTINGADGVGIRLESTEGGLRVLAGLPLVDPDAAQPMPAELKLERAFTTYVWDAGQNAFRAEE